MLTAIVSRADLDLLPGSIRQSFKNLEAATMRHHRPALLAGLQSAVAQEVRRQTISFELGVQILQARGAYGPKGKKAMREATP